jgi:hypothetical protein
VRRRPPFLWYVRENVLLIDSLTPRKNLGATAARRRMYAEAIHWYAEASAPLRISALIDSMMEDYIKTGQLLTPPTQQGQHLTYL